jgi:two-component system KDP operon response regulator KdpE
MANGPPRILVADDEFDTRKILSDCLKHQGFEIVAACDGKEALMLATAHPPDLALVDVWMPPPSGMALADQLKGLCPGVKVIIITAGGSIDEATEALRGGAFHYLTKPLRIKRVLAVVQEALTREAADQSQADKQADALTIDLARREVHYRGRLVSLTKLEFDLLAYLMQHRCRAVTFDELLNQVWGYPPVVGNPAQVRNTVRRLRKKLQDGAPCPGFIATVRGVGYRWDGSGRLKGLEEETEKTDTKRLRNGYRADMKRV